MAEGVGISLGLAAAKLILPPIADWVFAFRKTVTPRALPSVDVAKFEYWMSMLEAVESYSEPEKPEAEAEGRRAKRETSHRLYCQAAQNRSDEYTRLMLAEKQEETAAVDKAKAVENSLSERLTLERVAKEHCKRAEDYALLQTIAESEAKEEFVDRDVQTLFDCNREDLACRALVIVLQYSLLLCKKQELESRHYLIRAVASLPDKFVKNRNQSRMFAEHIWRELIVDSIAIQAWRDMPGHYLPYAFFKGVSVKPESASAKLLSLLILRTMRHIALLLEAIRRSEHQRSIVESFINDTLAINRFERSLLWETTCEILEAEGRSVPDLASYEFQGELMYPATKDRDGKYYVISADEKKRVKHGCAVDEAIIENSATLVQNVAKAVRNAVPLGGSRLSLSKSKDPLELSLAKYADFKKLLELFVECSNVIRDTLSKPKRHLQKYAEKVVNLAAHVLAYRYMRRLTFAFDAENLRKTSEHLRSRLLQAVVEERTK